MTRDVITGDALEVMAALEPDSFDAMLCDPPYGIEFMGKRWDHGVPSAIVWREALRVLKPGAFALVACGTRTQHRMASALEDAGFEIRDIIAWLYGSGFPKSLDVSKAIDKAAGGDREVVGKSNRCIGPSQAGANGIGTFKETNWEASNLVTAPATPDAGRWAGYGTALKPAMELWTLVRKPLDGTVAANALKHGVGGLNIDGSRVEVTGEHGGRDGEASAGRRYTNNGSTNFAATPGPRGGAPEGRWPANVIHDGSPEVLAGFPVTETWAASPAARGQGDGGGSMFGLGGINQRDADSGSAARFFYTAKASRAEREAGLDDFTMQTADPYAEHRGRRMPEGSDRFDGHPARQGRNPHPTVKPIALTTYLARLLLPPERDTPRRILVPFAGTGSEVIGAAHAGWEHVVGIEIDAAYARIARARIEHYTGLGPLFDGL